MVRYIDVLVVPDYQKYIGAQCLVAYNNTYIFGKIINGTNTSAKIKLTSGSYLKVMWKNLLVAQNNV